ncbi:MAG: nitrite/sulfite reductase [Rhodobacteraceae bacterium]|nr:nitrite/sulfite reductase [Paracoccaceae bacterium]
MYNYTTFDKDFVATRAAQFRDQVQRRIEGSLTEDEFKPLRLMNGLYLLLHAYMLRVAIPYGTLNSRQMEALADIADRWDKGYAHFSTRQNIQFHWPKLPDVPDILAALAVDNMHAIQTSGACIRAVTADHFAGAAADELADPRPTAELVRQWSTDHPEFAFLPRKFKVAVTGSTQDRAVTKFHDIGLRLVQNKTGMPGYEVLVGGGFGRTPMIGQVLRGFLHQADLLPYLEAILQVYNQIGRRDNKYKARIKITLHEHGLEDIRQRVEENFALQRARFDGADQIILARIESDFTPPAFKTASTSCFGNHLAQNPAFNAFTKTNLHPHKNPDYAIVTVSLKAHGATPGDASSAQMRALADIAKHWSHDELRVSHEQNIVLPHVHKGDLPKVYKALQATGLATANIGLISDLIACPGMDYCDLATARSTNVAQRIALRFDALKQEHAIGPLKIKISGCINACGHHHAGHIGILGLEKAGAESYQITLGGDGSQTAAIGKPTGKGFSTDEIVPAIERLIKAYLAVRHDASEAFLTTFRRLGPAPFKAALYPLKDTHNEL